jgi:hypothetical protein
MLDSIGYFGDLPTKSRIYDLPGGLYALIVLLDGREQSQSFMYTSLASREAKTSTDRANPDMSALLGRFLSSCDGNQNHAPWELLQQGAVCIEI